MIGNLHAIKQIGYESRAVLEAGDFQAYGRLLHEHWERKRVRSKLISNSRPSITGTRSGRRNGAVGGKLIGAGGGGFLMFLAEDPMHLRSAMEAEGLAEMRFKIDFAGTRIL